MTWNASGRESPTVSLQLGSGNPKRSAWLIVEGEIASGQLTVWESGECDLEAYLVDGGEDVLLEHRELSSLDELEHACCQLVAACEGGSYPGSRGT